MVRLFIENNEVELDNTVQFAITKQFEDLTNPTDIINDWSKTISIPFTEKNNELFGHIYNPDKVVVAGGTIGVYFNPLLKLDFRLEWNNAVLMTGYAKMNEIKQSAGKGTYEITLFGQLGKVFQEMQKITFDTTSDLTDYIIDGSQYVSNYINKNLVYDSWTSSGQTTEELLKTTDDGYNVTDIIGFAPNNSFNEDFDYKTAQITNGTSEQFEKILGSGFTTATGIEPATAIPDGLLPREIGEYRSYLQLPYIYWNKLFKIFKEKAEAVTGYEIELDKEWFNQYNPYWYNLVYMLKGFYSDGGSDDTYYSNIYSFWIPSSGYIYWGSAGYTQTKSTMLGASVVTENIPVLELSSLSQTGYDFNLDKFSGRIVGALPLSFRFLSYEEYYAQSQLNPNNGFVINVRIYDSADDTLLSDVQYLLCRSNTTIQTSGYTNIITYDDYSTGYNPSNLTDKFDFNIPLNMYAPRGHKVYFKISGKFVTTSSPIQQKGSQMFIPQMNLYLRSNNITLNLTDEIRSNAYFSLNTLWDNEYNLFQEILKYCKRFRLGVFIDDLTKKVKFLTLPKYFRNYTITDWTDKVDKNKDFNIKPVTFDNKYILFNYKDNETKLGKKYKDRYGVNYGDYRLITEYNFNVDTKELFTDITGSVTNTDNVLSWNNLYEHKVVYSFPNEIFVYNKDEDNKQVDLFGAYYYHNGLSNFATEESLNLRNVKISDDTPFQEGNNTYFYTQINGDYLISCSTYPALNVVNGDNLCIFNVPKENYTYINNYTSKNSIYTNLWDTYIDERYNVQNKQITCYMDIKPSDYNNFDFNHFIKIGNQLCMINKIYDYDVTSNETTKVDLITIQDVHGYTDEEYIENIDTLNVSYTGTTYIYGISGLTVNVCTFTSISDVVFSNNLQNITVNNILFTVSGNTIVATTLEPYVEEQDISFNITIHNQHNHSVTLNIVRYSTYPYPYISITDSSTGNVVTTLNAGNFSNKYVLNWERTETEEVDNHPTVTITTATGDNVRLGLTWSVEEKMYQDGDDEYFRNKYSIPIWTILTSGKQVTFTVTDKQGWYETKTYNVV